MRLMKGGLHRDTQPGTLQPELTLTSISGEAMGAASVGPLAKGKGKVCVRGDVHGALLGHAESTHHQSLRLRLPHPHETNTSSSREVTELAVSLLSAPACSSTCLHGEAALVVAAVAHSRRGLAFHLGGGDGAGVCLEVPAQVSQLQVSLS